MPSRAAITVMLLTRAKVHRADFASASGSPQITERERPDAPDLASLVETVLIDGPLPGKRTFVLATDFWLQTANIPASRAVGMSDADIAAGLNFEAEVLSGLSALDSAAAVAPLPPAGGERRFLLLQIPFAVRDSIERVLVDRGAKLAGLAHPAALPRTLGKDDIALQRLELWPDLAVGLKPFGAVFDAEVSNADPSTMRWQEDLGEWAGEEVLVSPGVAMPTGVKAFGLEGQRLNDWFAGWVAELTSRRPRAVVLQPPVKPTPPLVRLVFTAVLAAAAAGLAYFHWTNSIKQPISDAKARTATAKDMSKQFVDLQTRENEEKKKADASTQEVAKFDGLAERVEALRTRYARLMVALASESPTHVMIDSIDTTGGEPKVLGTALRPEMADAYARSLSPLVRDLGWDVQPPKKTAMKLSPDGGPWSFEIEFARLPDPPAGTKPKPLPKQPLPPSTVSREVAP